VFISHGIFPGYRFFFRFYLIKYERQFKTFRCLFFPVFDFMTDLSSPVRFSSVFLELPSLHRGLLSRAGFCTPDDILDCPPSTIAQLSGLSLEDCEWLWARCHESSAPSHHPLSSFSGQSLLQMLDADEANPLHAPITTGCRR
jgi:hypothetical protein